MKPQFIKVVDPVLAEKLAELGFQYIKEQHAFVFDCSDELMAVIQKQYSRSQFVCESKLRF